MISQLRRMKREKEKRGEKRRKDEKKRRGGGLLGLGWSECARVEGALEEGDREKQRLCPDLCPVSRPQPSCNTLQLSMSLSPVKFKEYSLL